jgi:hypothetical protein
MQVPTDFVIRCDGAAGSTPLREYAERRLAFALRGFEGRARHLKVRLSDVNGPRGGVDSRCSITLQLRDGRSIGVETTSAWPFASVTHAAKHLIAAVRREVDRAHAPTRRRRPKGPDVSS